MQVKNGGDILQQHIKVCRMFTEAAHQEQPKVSKYVLLQLDVLDLGLLCLKAYAKWQKFGQTVEERMKKDTKHVTWLAFMMSCSQLEKQVAEAAAQKAKIPSSVNVETWDIEFAASVAAVMPGDVQDAAKMWAGSCSTKAEVLASTLDELCKGYHTEGEGSWKHDIPNQQVFKSVHSTAMKKLEGLNGDAIDDTLKQMLQASRLLFQHSGGWRAW